MPKTLTKRARTEARGVTGRDSHIIAKALAYGIEAIGRLPLYQQEYSDRCDMIALLNTSNDADRSRAQAAVHLDAENWTKVAASYRPEDPTSVALIEESAAETAASRARWEVQFEAAVERGRQAMAEFEAITIGGVRVEPMPVEV